MHSSTSCCTHNFDWCALFFIFSDPSSVDGTSLLWGIGHTESQCSSGNILVHFYKGTTVASLISYLELFH